MSKSEIHNQDHVPDLEWMLRSQQVDDKNVVELLLAEYYQEIYQIALDRLVYPELAYQATRDIFTRAVQEAKSTPPETEISGWLHAIAVDEIEQSYAKQSGLRMLNSRLISALVTRRSQHPERQPDLDQAKRDILYQLQGKETRSINKSGMREAVLAGTAIIAIFLILKFAPLFMPAAETNNLDQETADQFAGPQSRFNILLEQELNQFKGSKRYLESLIKKWPLTIESNHDDIWRHILLSRQTWSSVWVDFTVILHGPGDYIGPPLVERHQVWLAYDQEQGVHLSGVLDGEQVSMELITIDKPGPGDLALLHGFWDFTLAGSQVPWFYLSSESIMSVPYMTNFFFIADYEFPPRELYFRAVEETVWAERPALVVEAVDSKGQLLATLWLDAVTGIALREQFFSGEGNRHVRLETRVDQIEYDRLFPERLLEKLFTHEDGYIFAANHTGIPESNQDKPDLLMWEALSSYFLLPAMHLPEDHDLSSSMLSFVMLPTGADQSQGYKKIALYADQYRLGELFLDDPWHAICTRSADGERIVISQWSQSAGEMISEIGWYDLLFMELNLIHIPQVSIARLAFSPDDALIAAAGINQESGMSELFLIDTSTNQVEFIPDFTNAWSLAWHPDGSQITTLGLPSFRLHTPWNLRLQTYDLVSRKITSETLENKFEWGYASIQIPLDGWTADFPLSMHGLEPCRFPG